MTLQSDIERIALQERRLVLPGFDNAVAWQLGVRLKALAEERALALTIEIRLARETVFFHAMPGTTPANADWARRKRNSVELLQQSSYGLGRELERDGSTLELKMGLPARDYAHHGGSFPLRVAGVGCVGTVTVSGAPQRVDHELVVRALAELCGCPPDELALGGAQT
ncbi:MAG: hypothetical protein RIQ60_582 [Pseudomonadota bacterium]|jgi:uncharacterized protein (UPF0303 family)